jgi:hypothetical protein
MDKASSMLAPLMSSIEIPLVKGVNYVAYPVAEIRSVREALRSIDGFYTLVRSYDPVTQRWLVFDPRVPDEANTLKCWSSARAMRLPSPRT